MDILFISPKTGRELTQYCESELLIEVMEHFANNGNIVEKKDSEHPNRWWVITDFISNNTIDNRKKFSVILSFAAIGGFIQVGERKEFGDVNVLNMLKDLYYISDNDYDFFVEAFYNFSQGKGVKFS